MEEEHPILMQWKLELDSICQSKAEEFHLLGYENVQKEEIWDCVTSKYRKEVPPLHQVVNDIFSLSVTKFMNWMTMKIYTGGFD